MKVAHSESEGSDDEAEDMTVEEEDDIPESADEESSDDEPEVNVWYVVLEDAETHDISVLESFKRNVIFCRSLERDETYQAVLNTMDKVKDVEEMKFSEALDYAVDKRKFLIQKAAEEAEENRREEEAQK